MRFTLKRNSGKDEQGALLAGAMMLSLALGIAMVALITSSQREIHQAQSLLAREHLRRMAQEKITRDLLSLGKDVDLTHFSTAPVVFAMGEVESSLVRVSTALPKFNSALYLVAIATLTTNDSTTPRHLRLETIIELAGAPASPSPPPPVPPDAALRRASHPVSVSQSIEDQLRQFLNDDQLIEEAKKQILSQLEEQFGSDVGSQMVSLETNQYRDPTNTPPPLPADQKSPDTFYMDPLSVETPKTGPRLRVWKEVYY